MDRPLEVSDAPAPGKFVLDAPMAGGRSARSGLHDGDERFVYLCPPDLLSRWVKG